MSQHPREMLKSLGLRAKESWGQNFLHDDEALSAIAEACQLSSGETVVELGPGLGHLTRALLELGAKVVAVERDRDMVAALEGQNLPGLKVVAANAADIKFAEVAQVTPVVVCGNLPYHLSSQIVFEVLDQKNDVKRAVFTLQNEVVERLKAGPGSRTYGILSVLVQLNFAVDKAAFLPASRFFPAPKVDSAVVVMERLPSPRAKVGDEARFRKVVKAAFAQRRKTLLNSLKSDESLATAEQWVQALSAADIDGKRRAETLSVEEFARLDGELTRFDRR